MDAKEDVLRRVWSARREGDFETVRANLADDIVWHEPGEADYSGDHRGADVVVSMLRRLHELTGGTFVFEPQGFVVSEEHVAARTRWSADRDGTHVEGNEIGVFRFENGRVAEAWFWYDGFDQAAHDVVFALD